MKRNSGFTLIELLVVITIIGILAGLAFPAVTGALEAAKKAEANAMVNQLKTAMITYQTEYGTWPSSVAPSTTADVTFNAGNLLKMFQGDSSTAAIADNPRRLVFMEFNSKVLRASDPRLPADPPSTATTFVDPWNNEYQIALDADYDGQITGPEGLIRASVLVWSNGKVDSGSTASTFDDKDPKSW